MLIKGLKGEKKVKKYLERNHSINMLLIKFF